MAKQTFTTGQVLTAAQMTSLQQTAMGGGSPSTKTASYVLTAADAGTVIQMNSASATTITVNTSLFAAGDSVQIQNIGAGTMTITAGTATVNSAGSLGVTQYDGGFLYFSSASSAIWFDFTQAGTTLPLTTKGDLFGYDTGNARIPIGTNNQVLTADSTQALGLKWATPSSGGITLITETTASALSSINYSSIPSTYKELLLVWDGITTDAGGTYFQLRFNGDTGSNYYGKVFLGTTAVSVVEASGNSMSVGESSQSFVISANSGSSLSRAWAGSLRVYNYASSTKLKRWDYQSMGYYTSIGAMRGGITVGTYDSTTAISSIQVDRISASGTLSNITNTSIRLYGIS